MAENPHYKELLQLLNEFEVEYLIVDHVIRKDRLDVGADDR
jgi:hypothetical protein